MIWYIYLIRTSVDSIIGGINGDIGNCRISTHLDEMKEHVALELNITLTKF